MSYIEINGEQMMKCNYCGNVWDGYAQCNCWKWIDYAEVDAEQAEQLQIQAQAEQLHTQAEQEQAQADQTQTTS